MEHLTKITKKPTPLLDPARPPDVHISRTYRFAAAHSLPMTPKEHKCHRMHGHNYEVEVTLSGQLDVTAGWLIDYAVIDEAWRATCGPLDHTTLNDHAGLENPTAEILAVWIWSRMGVVARVCDLLYSVRVSENERSSATYFGPLG